MRTRTTRAAVGIANRRLVLAVVLALLAIALAAAAVGAGLLLNRTPAETAADWPGFRGTANHSGIAADGPVGNPVLAWQFHAGGQVLEATVVGDRVFFAAGDGRLYAVARDRGFQVWSIPAGEPPITGPYAADGRLYVVDGGGTVRSFAQADGSAVWASPARYATPSRPIVADGTLYLGTGDGLAVAIDTVTGAERWRVRLPGATRANAPAYANGLLYVGTVGGGFVAIDTAAHQIAWTQETGDAVTGTAGVADGIAYVGAGAEATSGTLRAFDAMTGRPLWAAGDALLQFPAVANGVAYTSTSSGLVVALDTSNGATRWRVQLQGEVRPPVVSGRALFLFAGNEHRVYALDAASGGKLWQFDVAAYGRCCIAVAHGAVYVGLDDGSVWAIAGDGATLTPAPFPSAAPTVAPSAAASASATPAATPLAPIGIVGGTIDMRGHGLSPVCQLAVDPTGRVWVPEAETGKIAIFDATGTLLEEWSAPPDSAGAFDFTRDNGDGYGTLAFAKDGSFFVLDVGNKRVQAFDAKRRFIRAWGSFGGRPGEFTDPVGIAVAPDGTVWVLDDVRGVVEHDRPDGTVIGSFDPFADQPVNDGANSLAIDAAGNLYVSLVDPSQVLVFDPAGKPLRVIGAGTFAEQAGTMAVDEAGRLFVTQGPDRGSALGVLVFDPAGALVGGFGPSGRGDGEMVFPGGIGLDGKGGLWLVDSIPESARLMHLQLIAPAR